MASCAAVLEISRPAQRSDLREYDVTPWKKVHQASRSACYHRWRSHSPALPRLLPSMPEYLCHVCYSAPGRMEALRDNQVQKRQRV